MRKRALMGFVVTTLAMAAAATALDQIRVLGGPGVSGNVVEMSPLEVKIEQGVVPKKIPVNTIDYITFDEEPKELTNGRKALTSGRYSDALQLLNKIDMTEVKRREIVQDIEYYRAIAAVRLALGGSGSKAEAGKQLLAFEKNNGGSYHYLDAAEVVGDLLVSLGKGDQAETYYNKLASAPWPDYKMRAGVLIGRALQGQKEYAKAIQKYDDVIGNSVEGKEADKQRLAASLGKATCLAASGKVEDGVKMIEGVIAKAEPESLELHARAYNALGNTYKAAGKKKEALLAFLHVDVLYPGLPEQHAEALANLATLWGDVDKKDRATQAKAQLLEKYPNSRWTKH